MKIPSTKTEHRAVNALEVIIDNHSTMEHQFNENDKEMSWDGYIWLYKNNNGDQSKTVFCKHLMPKVACEKCTKVHVHFVHYCSGRAAGQATANISVISSF